MTQREVVFRLMILLGLILSVVFIIGQFALKDYSLKQNEHRRKLGAVYMTLNNPFYEIIDEEIRAAVENHGDVLVSRNPSLSVEKQKEEVQELIDNGVRLLFINPVDWKEIEPALEIARRAGVPVVAIDTSMADDKNVACTIESDNYMAGVQCANHLVAHAKGGKIALLKHTQAKSACERIAGFLDIVERYPQFIVVDEEECLGQLEVAMPAMEKMLGRHPDIDIVMALNDPSAMGAVAALKNRGLLGKVMVYGVDGVAETQEMVINGYMVGTALQKTRRIGELAVEQAYRILEGKEVEKVIKLPTVLITKENVYQNKEVGY